VGNPKGVTCNFLHFPLREAGVLCPATSRVTTHQRNSAVTTHINIIYCDNIVITYQHSVAALWMLMLEKRRGIG
jgi:hypothetical protein